jgi:hypothetical protein
MNRLTFNEFNLNISDDASAWQFLESQISRNEKCDICAHYKLGKCELNVCNYKLKKISLYYLVR